MPRSLYACLAQRFAARPPALDRREFLRRSLAASAGLLFGSAHGLAAPSQSARRVIVVGAGLSGLACADALRRAGCEVVVLESRRRIGGRVLSFHDLAEGKSVEAGGEFIGANHPTWLSYARRFGLKLEPIAEDENAVAPVVLGGRRLEEKEAKALFEEMDAAHKQLAHGARSVHADEPWTTPNARALDLLTTARWVESLSISPLAKRAVCTDFTTLNGVSVRRQSHLGNCTMVKGGGLEKFWTDSESFRCRGGNHRLAEHLARALGERRLRLETPVVSIRIEAHHAVVKTAAGELIEADDVVLAVPPSVWYRIAFSPALPWSLRPQMGRSVKFLAVLKKRFWRERGLSADARTDGLIGGTWEAGSGSAKGDAVMTAFSSASAAEACRRRWRTEGAHGFVRELDVIYPGFAAVFSKGRFVNWPGDPWTQGGYSFPAPGQITTQGPLLRRGFGRLHFAGEHACYKFVGYMEGALQTGLDAARKIVAPASSAAG